MIHDSEVHVRGRSDGAAGRYFRTNWWIASFATFRMASSRSLPSLSLVSRSRPVRAKLPRKSSAAVARKKVRADINEDSTELRHSRGEIFTRDHIVNHTSWWVEGLARSSLDLSPFGPTTDLVFRVRHDRTITAGRTYTFGAYTYTPTHRLLALLPSLPRSEVYIRLNPLLHSLSRSLP